MEFKKIQTFYHIINATGNNIILDKTILNPEDKRFSQTTIDKAFERINNSTYPIKLKNNQKNYIYLTGRFDLDWIYKAIESEYIQGGFKFKGLWESLCLKSHLFKHLKNSNVNYPFTTEEETFLAQLKPFVTAYDHRRLYGCFLRNTPNFPPPIYFYDEGLYFPMNVDLDGYLEAMFASFATYRWQYFYIDEFNPEMIERMGKLAYTFGPNRLYYELEKIAHSLPKAFPNHDFSYHQKRLVFLKEVLTS